MSAITYGKRFIFGVPTQEEILAIQHCLMADQIIVSNEDFLKIVRNGNKYAVEQLPNGYSAFLLDDD